MVVCLLPMTGRQRIAAEGILVLKQNPGPGLCHVAHCRNRHADDRKKVAEVRLCHRCWQLRWRMRNPKQAAFATLRMHARKRKIPFTLSFEKFVEITDEAGYWDQDPETHGDKLSVDRIKGHLGYSDDNVEVITKGENSAKGNRERWLPAHVRAMVERRRRQQQERAWQMAGAREDSWLD